MDWSQVTALTIPEGSVKQVAVNGVVLWRKSLLPSGYTQLEYIESTGIQYINTGVSANANTIVEYTFNFVKIPTSGALFGSGTTPSSTDRFQGYYESGAGFSSKLSSTTTYADVFLTANTKHYSKIGIPLKGYYIDEKFTSAATGTPTNLNLYIFGRNLSGEVGSPSSLRIYSFKISENETLIRNFIPAIRNSDSKVGMYDTVTKQFFTNAGTGEFIAGPRFVEYIHFDGNSWIDIGYTPSSNTRVVGKVSFTKWNDIVANYAFGVFGEGANFGFNVSSDRGIMNVPWGSNSGIKFNNTNTFGQIYSFDISNKGAYLDGELKLPSSQLSETFTATKSFFVGWSNGTSVQKLIGNIYPIQIYENDVLVKDLRPCLDGNNVACMYDMITKKYFYNKGTGNLIAGAPSGYTQLEYTQNDSDSLYIKTGVHKEI